MKILLAGNWQWSIYEKSFSDALISLQHTVICFSYRNYFKGVLGRFEEKIPFPGLALRRLNREILKVAFNQQPEVIIFWRGTHILPSTIKVLNDAQILTVSYNNDDPFGGLAGVNVPWHHHFLWTWYLKNLRDMRLVFMYRSVNIPEAAQYGAQNVYLLRSYFVPEYHYPVNLTGSDIAVYGCDVAFVGHYEPDQRVNYLRSLVEAGCNVKLYGDRSWSRNVLGDLYEYFFPIQPARNENYPKALCGAKICLAFLSKMNRDSYTRRCFEIPACGRLMLAERTPELLQMFKENEDACFFSSTEELVDKTKYLLRNPAKRQQISDAGRRRVWLDGHDVKSRVAEAMKIINKYYVDLI